ncbi:hypothetical protein [Tsukamurella pulmonis]|uniref:hypothetical protein n=1 Tax=Tsukamurella pulmonis TaxID=47312 RepID=UPI001058CF4D|nr:hypothetical protein [Tsukamurella pulmonis]
MTAPDPGADPEPCALPAWVEAELANRRAHWATLRDGGALASADEAEAIRREVDGLTEIP